jgi:hypothetical protein
MRSLQVQNKRALSEMLSYALLVVIALGLSAAVYAWIWTMVPKQQEKCDDQVSLVIDQYSCDDAAKEINITFKNKGNWVIEGFIIRASNKSGIQPVYPLPLPGKLDGRVYSQIMPDASASYIFTYSKLKGVASVNVKPFQVKNKKMISCDSAAITQDIDCAGVSGPPPPSYPAGLVSWWKFEGNGNDELGGNNLDVASSATYEAGKVGSALRVGQPVDFAGTSQVKENLKLNGDFSLEAWFNISSIPSSVAFIIGEFNGATPNYALKIETSGKIGVYFAGQNLFNSTTTINTGEWYHVIVTKSGQTFNLYINGNPEGNGNSAGTPTYTNSDQLYVGRIGDGLTDEVKVYNINISP